MCVAVVCAYVNLGTHISVYHVQSTWQKKIIRPYPYMSPPSNKPTKTGHHTCTTPTTNIYCYDYYYYNSYDIILLGYNFHHQSTPDMVICIPLCYNLHTLGLFGYPVGLKYPSFRNPVLHDFKKSSIFSWYLWNSEIDMPQLSRLFSTKSKLITNKIWDRAQSTCSSGLLKHFDHFYSKSWTFSWVTKFLRLI